MLVFESRLTSIARFSIFLGFEPPGFQFVALESTRFHLATFEFVFLAF